MPLPAVVGCEPSPVFGGKIEAVNRLARASHDASQGHGARLGSASAADATCNPKVITQSLSIWADVRYALNV